MLVIRRDLVDAMVAHARRDHRETVLAFAEPAHRAIGGGQPVGAAAGEHDRVRLLHRVGRFEHIGLAGAGAAAAHVDRRGRAARGEHHAGTGRPLLVEPLLVPHEHAAHVGDRVPRS